jgi:uncharacterized Tic20 family protein
MANKKEHAFVDYNGKQALNFQISLLLYSVILGIISVPFFFGIFPNIFEGGIFEIRHFNEFNIFDFHFDHDDFHIARFWPLGIAGMLQAALFVINIVYTILATLRTNDGQYFKYPITIKFIR